MITVVLMGGLGNQMFQYAFGLATARKLNTKLRLSTGFLRLRDNASYTIRDYELGIFKAKPALTSVFFTNIWLIRISKFFLGKKFVNESTYAYDKSLVIADCATYRGYFQTEKYFCDSEDEIRKTLEFDLAKLTQLTRDIAEEISHCLCPVSIHVRRGDYVSNPVSESFHGVCDSSYYNRAVAHIGENLKGCKFFVFSDDIKWAKENLGLKSNTVYVSHNSGVNSWQDMYLMSLCQHQIIANSSFSWWGAWLNRNPHKVVIAPKKWFAVDSIDTSDLVPVGWVRV